jgi:hypothetical protein
MPSRNPRRIAKLNLIAVKWAISRLAIPRALDTRKHLGTLVEERTVVRRVRSPCRLTVAVEPERPLQILADERREAMSG